MKTKNLFFIALLLLSNAAFSQWTTSGTNIYNSNTGNVGIGTGTTAPSQKLQVNGNIQLNGDASGILYGKSKFLWAYEFPSRTVAPSNFPRATVNAGFGSFNNNNTSPWADYLEFNSYTGDASGGRDNMLVIMRSGFGMRLYQQDIGSTSPFTNSNMMFTPYMDIPLVSQGVANYNVPRIVRTSGGLELQSSKINDNGSSVDISTSLYTQDNITIRGLNGATLALGTNSSTQHSFNGYSDGAFYYRFGGVNRMIFRSDNTVQIKGDLILKTSIGDWVFEKDYNLLTINEVEQYINQNGHLPGMMSAQEVKEKHDGSISVNDFQSRLLVKIEELTLYTIQQNKSLENQDKEIELLKKEIQQLKNK